VKPPAAQSAADMLGRVSKLLAAIAFNMRRWAAIA
jgi:hypothetical protein